MFTAQGMLLHLYSPHCDSVREAQRIVGFSGDNRHDLVQDPHVSLWLLIWAWPDVGSVMDTTGPE